MFGWWPWKREARPVRALPECGGQSDLDNLFQRDLAMIFKHSPACSVSWAAHALVARFYARHPLFPLYVISVTAERETSRRIAQRTGVVHESPQIILLRRGVAVSTASHGEITSDYLAGLAASHFGHAPVAEEPEANAAPLDLVTEHARAPHRESE